MVDVAGWPVILTGWPVMVGVVDTCYGVSQPGADTGRYRCAFRQHTGWLGVVTASTGGSLGFISTQGMHFS